MAAAARVTPRGTNFTDVAVQVLEAVGQPMHAHAIAVKAQEMRLIYPHAKDPKSNMQSKLAKEVKEGGKDKKPSRFYRSVTGKYGLVKWREWSPAEQPSLVPADLVGELSKLAQSRLQDLAPADFEKLVMGLLGDFGCQQYKRAQRNRDGSFYIKCTLVVGEAVRMVVVVFATNQQGEVDATSVELVRGKLRTYEQGVVFAAGGFSSQARREAARKDAPPVGLIGGELLSRLLVKSLSQARQAQA